jgi:hypothetical protein
MEEWRAQKVLTNWRGYHERPRELSYRQTTKRALRSLQKYLRLAQFNTQAASLQGDSASSNKPCPLFTCQSSEAAEEQ